MLLNNVSETSYVIILKQFAKRYHINSSILPKKKYLDLTQLKVCSSLRCTCMLYMKLLPLILQKLLQMLRFAQTNKPTDRALCKLPH
jgi:hypothetical protein